MNAYRTLIAFIAAALLCCSLAAQTEAAKAAPASPAADLVKQGRTLVNEGKYAEAYAIYHKAIEADPKSWDAHLSLGVLLDLQGNYAEGQKHIGHAIELAPPANKNMALRTMGFAHAFAGDGKSAAKFHKQVFDQNVAKQEFEAAAGVANEGARLLLETGNIDEAENWYRMGYENAMRKPGISEADKNLWLFRWEHAQARIAARRGNKSAAQQHVTAAKAALEKANQPEQAEYLPYLTGYVAFYSGDHKAALADLAKANQKDPFILALMAQSHEKLGDKAKATELYRQILTFNNHNPTNAYARPLAQRKLAGK